ncbi:MAG: hypothetical protein ACOYU2_04370 [Nitrospirota bacterium]
MRDTKNPKSRTVSFKVSASGYETLKETAREHGDTVSKHCRQLVLTSIALNDFSEKLEKQLRKIFYQSFRANCALNVLALKQLKDEGYAQFIAEVERQIEVYKKQKEEGRE